MDVDERLNKIESSLSKFETSLNNIGMILEAIVSKKAEIKFEEAPKLGVVPPEIPKPVEIPKIEALKVAESPKLLAEPTPVVASKEVPVELINLLNSKEWPAAVDPTLICDITSDQDKEDRAEGILDLIIDAHLENLKFLDFGCGEGHVVNKSKIQNPRMSVGYDIVKSEKWEKWEKTPNSMFTDDWSSVKSAGPYNVILMYDVLDHMTGSIDEVVSKLKDVKSVLAPNGKIYVRTHPWCSRHGTHLYHKLNKAYVHLVFSNEELESLGHKQQQVRPIIHPMAEYEGMFTKAGLKVISKQQIKEAVEGFFIKNPTIALRIKKNYSNSPDSSLRNGAFPTFQLEQQFIDYVLG